MPPQTPQADADHIMPTQHDYTISLNHVMERFNAEGIGRTKRRLAELCQRGVLEGKKFKTTHGDTWFVTAASLEAAVQQIKTEERLAAAAGDGRLKPAPPSASSLAQPALLQARPFGDNVIAEEEALSVDLATAHDDAGARRVEQAPSSKPTPDAIDIFTHPYVLKLEHRNEQLEKKLDEQTRRTETIQREAFDQLIQLQRSSQIAQSQTLADFFVRTRDFLLGRTRAETPVEPETN